MTLKDISEQTGFSITTISRVINHTGYVNEETAKIIKKAAEEGGYFQKKKNSSTNNNLIGVIVPDLSNPFFGAVIKGIKEITEVLGKEVIIMDTGEDIQAEKRALEVMRTQKLCGLIITPISDGGHEDNDSTNEEYDIEKTLTELNIPVVLVDRDVRNSSFDGVFVNNVQGAYEITSYLIQKGYSQIAIISGPRYSKPGRERLKGYRNALERYGFERNDSLFYEGDFSFQSGYDLTNKILESNSLPDAIFCCNNLMTMGCIKALTEHNIKPGIDIMLAGFDKLDFINHVLIKMVAVDRPTKEMGRAAAEILLQKPKIMDSNVIRSGIRMNLMPKLVICE